LKKIDIIWKKRALKFVQKNHQFSTEEIEELIVLSIKKHIFGENISIDSIPMKGDFSGSYRIRKGKVRILFSIGENNEIVIEAIVENIDFRGDIYK
jgi:mRNA-degrading endonuclease RelE of RelBE toxin-antitoxin system